MRIINGNYVFSPYQFAGIVGALVMTGIPAADRLIEEVESRGYSSGDATAALLDETTWTIESNDGSLDHLKPMAKTKLTYEQAREKAIATLAELFGKSVDEVRADCEHAERDLAAGTSLAVEDDDNYESQRDTGRPSGGCGMY